MRSFLRKITPTPPPSVKTLLLLLSTITTIYFFLSYHLPPNPPHHHHLHLQPLQTPTSTPHLLFSIASSSHSLPSRKPYIRLWYSSSPLIQSILFLDTLPNPETDTDIDTSIPPILISNHTLTSSFPYTFPRGLKSAIRVARIVKQAVNYIGSRNGENGVRWYVFGDDDTVFFVDNLVNVLCKYDYRKWFYVGSLSESYEQNEEHSFDMAYGGGGFAISSGLAEVLANVLDSCLMRYGHLYGSDERIYSCVTELGVGLTREPGFHQVDVRGNLFGMLCAHPLSPLLSLHHIDAADPIFPLMNKTESMEHLFKAARIDPYRILQQTVCYDNVKVLTVSVSWGYAVQVCEGNVLLPDLLRLQKTFKPWRRNRNLNASRYMFNTRIQPKDPCKNSAVFFRQSLIPDGSGTLSSYRRYKVRKCVNSAINYLKHVNVFSTKLEIDTEELRSPRRQCCSVRSSSRDSMAIEIRHCGTNELISMQQGV